MLWLRALAWASMAACTPRTTPTETGTPADSGSPSQATVDTEAPTGPTGPTREPCGASGDFAVCSLSAHPDRPYTVYRPSDHDLHEATAVVLVFHGGNGNSDSAIQMSCPGAAPAEADRTHPACWHQVAELHGFVVVYPNGTGTREEPTMRAFNAGGGGRWQCVGGQVCEDDVNDVGYTARCAGPICRSGSMWTPPPCLPRGCRMGQHLRIAWVVRQPMRSQRSRRSEGEISLRRWPRVRRRLLSRCSIRMEPMTHAGRSKRRTRRVLRSRWDSRSALRKARQHGPLAMIVLPDLRPWLRKMQMATGL